MTSKLKYPVVIVTPVGVELVADEVTLRTKFNYSVVKTNAKPLDRVIAERTFAATVNFMGQ
jgi:hypothetical protein